LITALACLPLTSGCDSKPYRLAPVSGVVTLDGRPLAGGQVSFQPEGAGDAPGPGSAGYCDDAGRYVLKTIRDEPGAVPGTHRVRIYGPKSQAPASSDSDAGSPRKELIPPKYNFGSELTLIVPEAGTDTANFELSSE
jgi:hypothetical protein